MADRHRLDSVPRSPGKVTVYGAWERFVRGEDDVRGVRPEVALSWQRCRDRYRVDPYLAEAPVAIADVDHTLEHDVVFAELGFRAASVVQEVTDLGGVVTVTDATGRVLAEWGNKATRNYAAKANLAPWFSWAEGSTGTNGMGTALESQSPVVIRGALGPKAAGADPDSQVRGHIDCWDLETGEQRWRCYTIPRPGEPGSETWPSDGEAWTRGGANHWVTGTYDPETNLYYAGTGNPAPDFDGAVREGDNLYSDSVVAVDVDTGEIQWHYQFTPHDLWDYDSTMEMTLFERDGKKLLGHFDKNGYFFVLDRTNGELQHVTPYVDRIDWGTITRDGKVTPRKYPDKEGEPVHFYPGPAGAKEWTHAAFSPRTEMFYVPVADVGATATRRRREFKEGMPYWGAAVQVDIDNMAGSVSAFDTYGVERWRWRNSHPMAASVLATAGDLVFAGTPTGEFLALDARTGEELWKFQCGSGHHGSAMTYMVDGKQYVAVPVGWGGWLEGIIPGMLGAGHGSALIVFALPD
ncbi:outer membrane protein assembly factor BamB family protein [Haloactinomyces albus]|uniref:PQQ-dependent dehydrogenase (Methanol/ethanol family) n=1 Tax=Haloactinomyces albus TaxID=1352928 RepID=A0AAE3ZI44_9ACTN|nr:PQQ-binding-like beta-propeller repeat protein [Haloactinomyces albus]MDR7304560.1 PQQ-dependent dehydrogenase (methanol/ethanol family) [Haloactinomyces albus]